MGDLVQREHPENWGGIGMGPAVASTRVQSWGDEAPKKVGSGERVFSCPHGTPHPTGGGVWEGQFFLFCDLKMAYFGEF